MDAKRIVLVSICFALVCVASSSRFENPEQQEQPAQFCKSRDADCSAAATADVSDSCADWARAEAAAETVPDWLDRLRLRYPCPADAAAAKAAVDAGAWLSDFCCAGSSSGGSWLPAAATAWLKSWLCGGPDCGYHIGAEFCIRSRPLELPDGTSARQQCCYRAGQLLTDPTAGAGTSDRRADVFGHWSVDVRPFLTCCQQLTDNGSANRLVLNSAGCALYFSRRPTNHG